MVLTTARLPDGTTAARAQAAPVDVTKSARRTPVHLQQQADESFAQFPMDAANRELTTLNSQQVCQTKTARCALRATRQVTYATYAATLEPLQIQRNTASGDVGDTSRGFRNELQNEYSNCGAKIDNK